MSNKSRLKNKTQPKSIPTYMNWHFFYAHTLLCLGARCTVMSMGRMQKLIKSKKMMSRDLSLTMSRDSILRNVDPQGYILVNWNSPS